MELSQRFHNRSCRVCLINNTDEEVDFVLFLLESYSHVKDSPLDSFSVILILCTL